jgi:hypothetical protein
MLVCREINDYLLLLFIYIFSDGEEGAVTTTPVKQRADGQEVVSPFR